MSTDDVTRPPGDEPAGQNGAEVTRRLDTDAGPQQPGLPYLGQAPATYPPAQPAPSSRPGAYPPVGHTGSRARERRRVGVGPLTAVALVAGLVGGGVGAAAVAILDDPVGRTASDDVDQIAVDAPPLEIDNTSVIAVADSLLPSVVQIKVSSGQRSGTGSGFVLDDEGHVVTNNHVVEVAAERGTITVVLEGGEERDARIVGRSPSYDLAVIQVDVGGLTPASIGDSERLRVGEPVVAIGSPLGLTSTVTSGIVSALSRPVTAGGVGEASFISAIQTDAAINPGNSGGPLVNLSGQVIGVNSAIATVGAGLGGEAGNIGVGFAIPMAQVRRTVDQLLVDGEAQYPVIGASVATNVDTGAIISAVNPDSPAENAGLEEDDVITSVDGTSVDDGVDLIVAIREHQPGETIELTYERDGDASTVSLVLDGLVG
ncbi:MAG: trypsin-like peptidase domain-containing protein [Actinomycetota bacterium]|nr:trypsin-like peptidase domain-containing protein [Actinomycetota bacterium]